MEKCAKEPEILCRCLAIRTIICGMVMQGQKWQKQGNLHLIPWMIRMIWVWIEWFEWLLIYSCELFYFMFLPALKVLSYARKSCSLSNICSSLFNFIGNLFELADLFFLCGSKVRALRVFSMSGFCRSVTYVFM